MSRATHELSVASIEVCLMFFTAARGSCNCSFVLLDIGGVCTDSIIYSSDS